MKRFLLWSAIILIVLALLPQILGSGVRLIGELLFGWVGFLKRVGPEISVSGSGIGMGVACSALIIAGIHWLANWICDHNSSAKEKALKWKWSYSWSLYAGLWFLFLAAIGITGLVHQTVWLIKSREPIMVARKHPLSDLYRAARNLGSCAENKEWNLAETRKSFLELSVEPYSGKSVIEGLHVLFLPAKDGTLAAAIAFPREPAQQSKTGLVLIERGAKSEEQKFPIGKLPEILAKFRLPEKTAP